jgi:2-(1,2-epoxy-1,2-dihydrophenyl)acetyl-CoA isomerase
VLQGKGNGFCGGGDVKDMYTAKDKPHFLRELTKIIHKCVIEMRTMEKPVIAVVDGAAFGAGFSLALAADMIIATNKAMFSTAFISIGLAPGCGTQLFSQLVGYHRACEYIFTSKVFSATEAEHLGIINKVVESTELDAQVEYYAKIFRTFPTIAVGKAKMLINASLDNSFNNHLELESITAAYTAGTRDFTEGVTAFVEKRKPQFKGS